MLTPWLWVSRCSAQVSEYREQEANFFGILSFGQGHCCLMPENLCLALLVDEFLWLPASFSHNCRDYLMPQPCFTLLFYQRGSLFPIWLGLHSLSSHSKPLPVGTSSFPSLSAPWWPPLFWFLFSMSDLSAPEKTDDLLPSRLCLFSACDCVR